MKSSARFALYSKLIGRSVPIVLSLFIVILCEKTVVGIPQLHKAVYYLNLKGVAELIHKGGDVNQKDAEGKTPLFYCLYPVSPNQTRVRDAIMALLISKGALVNVKDRYGVTPLHESLAYGNTTAAETLLHHGASIMERDSTGATPLHKASATAPPLFVKKLLDAGAAINAVDNGGWTPLHEAAENGNVGVVSLLIRYNADVHAENEEGNTPLHLASLEDSEKAVAELISAGADVNRKNVHGNTPLFLAIRESGFAIAQLLVDKGSRVNVKNNDSLTPLHRAAFFGLNTIALMLIEHGAEVHAATPYGVVPLHLAVQWGHLDMVKLLIEHGADYMVRVGSSREGMTPLHLAAHYGQREIARYLLEKGASLSAKDDVGKKPFDRAMDAKHRDVALLFATYYQKDEPYYFVIAKDQGNGLYFATSYKQDRGSRVVYSPKSAFDGNQRTCWISGKRDAVGERIAFITRVPFKSIRVFPGSGINKAAYKRNSRLKSAMFYLYALKREDYNKAGVSFKITSLLCTQKLEFQDSFGFHEFSIPFYKNRAKEYLGILEIKEVYPGRGYTCIAEITCVP